MAAPKGGGGARGFRELTLGPGTLQTARERFDSTEALDLIQTRERTFNHAFDDDSDDDSVQYPDGVPLDQISVDNPWNGPEDVNVPLETRVPMMQHSRNNLTALSQKYNLYFAAYGNRIFVYRPRDIPNQRLPQEPDLILATMPDAIAKRIGGHQDTRLFHQSNAIQVGSLGRREILVLVYDDGSVFAYNVDDIASFIDSKALNKDHSIPRPFLHENVGSSSWGIAIHQTSRLIAVSSNRYEVTVFAFGLTHPAHHTQVPKSEMAAMSVATRKRTWRIILFLGSNGHNIPNISFWDDKDGLAEKVCAMDIRGNTWVLDIWKPHTAPVKLGPVVQGLAAMRSPGWGALVLPHTSFVAAAGTSDALGLTSRATKLDAQVSGRLDITQSLRSVRDNPAANDRLPAGAGGGPPAQAVIIHAVQTAAGNGTFAALEQLMGHDAGFMSSEDEGDDDDNVWLPDLAVLNTTGPPPPALPAALPPQGDDDDSSDSDDTLYNHVNSFNNLSNYMPAHLLPAFGPSIVYSHWPTSTSNLPSESPQSSEYTPSGSAPYPPGLQTFKVATDKDLSALGGIFDLSPEAERALHGELVYIPSRGAIFAFPYAVEPRILFFRRRIEVNVCQKRQVLDEEPLRPSSVLRTYVADLELSSNRPAFVDVVCRNPAGMPSPLSHPVRRLHMIIHVPELSLVVVGSAVGRVILLTPTRVKGEPVTVGRNPDDPELKYGFRVDWVLPRAKDEVAAGRKTQLYGVAVGPVQEGNGSAASLLLRAPRSKRKTAAGPGTRRYRLMMHFRDHSIMTYDLSRNGEGTLNIM